MTFSASLKGQDEFKNSKNCSFKVMNGWGGARLDVNNDPPTVNKSAPLTVEPVQHERRPRLKRLSKVERGVETEVSL